jgi:hypothetical protein
MRALSFLLAVVPFLLASPALAADAVTSQTLQDSDDYLIMHFTNLSDGTGESAVTKVDISTFDVSGRNGATPSEVVIEEVEYSVSGMSVSILCDATSDVRELVLGGAAGAISGKMNFLMSHGGLPNNCGTGKNGDLLFTTSGHSSGDSYDITLKMRKKY